jgi:DNA-binding NarL/FixJ family response regulator
MPREPGQLTEREIEVLVLVANGFTSKQISARLGVGMQGIHSRLAAAGRVLGASSRTHLVALAIAGGFIDVAEIHPANR